MFQKKHLITLLFSFILIGCDTPKTSAPTHLDGFYINQELGKLLLVDGDRDSFPVIIQDYYSNTVRPYGDPPSLYYLENTDDVAEMTISSSQFISSNKYHQATIVWQGETALVDVQDDHNLKGKLFQYTPLQSMKGLSFDVVDEDGTHWTLKDDQTFKLSLEYWGEQCFIYGTLRDSNKGYWLDDKATASPECANVSVSPPSGEYKTFVYMFELNGQTYFSGAMINNTNRDTYPIYGGFKLTR